MQDWNVVVTVNEDGYRNVRQLLERYGKISQTQYYNVMVMRVTEPTAMLQDLAEKVAESPGLMNDLSRVVPARGDIQFSKRRAV